MIFGKNHILLVVQIRVGSLNLDQRQLRVFHLLHILISAATWCSRQAHTLQKTLTLTKVWSL